MHRERAKVLILSLQGIGNTALALPAIKKYAEGRSPELTMVVSNSGFQEVLERLDFITQIYFWDENKSFAANLLRLRRRLRRQVFDEAFAADPNGRRENLLLFMIRSKEKRSLCYRRAFFRMFYFLHPASPTREEIWHDTEANSRLFAVSGNSDKAVDLRSIISPEEKASAKELLSNHPASFYVTIHPGSRMPNKRWSVEKYIKVCNRLISRYDCGFVLIGGSGELALREEIAGGLRNHAIVLKGTNLPQTMAVMSETQLFFGSDSGPMHIAACLGLPMFVLSGYSDYTLTSPLSDDCLIIRKRIPCSPCYNFLRPMPERCDLRFKCIHEIGVGETYTILRRYIESRLLKNNVDELEAFSDMDAVESMERLKNGPLLLHLRAPSIENRNSD